MTVVDRAAAVIQDQIDGDLYALNGTQGLAFAEWFGERCAGALADAGLLVSDTMPGEYRAGSSVDEQRTHNASDAGSIPAPPTNPSARWKAHAYPPPTMPICSDCGVAAVWSGVTTGYVQIHERDCPGW